MDLGKIDLRDEGQGPWAFCMVPRLPTLESGLLFDSRSVERLRCYAGPPAEIASDNPYSGK
jgi:hypothetical protein